MAVWVDRNKQPHTLRIDLAVARRLKAECDLDLLAALKDPEALRDIFAKLSDKPENLVAAAAVVENVTDHDGYASCFDGDALWACCAALIEAIIDFFPLSQRMALRRMLAAATQAVILLEQQAQDRLEQLTSSSQFISDVNSSLIRGNGSNESQESSATATDSPSGKSSGDTPGDPITTGCTPAPSSPACSTPSEPDAATATGTGGTFTPATYQTQPWEQRAGT